MTTPNKIVRGFVEPIEPRGDWSRASSGGRSSLWTAERVATLKRLLDDPRQLTTRQIASALGGVSRNAVIGKVARLGLRLPNEGLRNPYAPRVLRKGRATIFRDFVGLGTTREARQLARAARPKHIAFLDLEPHHCRWPYGRRLPYAFCGCDRAPRSPYCDIHTRLSVEPAPMGESHEQAESTRTTPSR